MAPPTNRRTGHSRKAQISAFAGYVVAAFGALAGGILLVVSLWKPDAASGLRGVASDVTAPIGETGAATRESGLSTWDTIRGYWDAGSKNARLEQEVREAHVRLAEAEAIAAENKRLKALLGLREEEFKPVAFARLIGSSSASTRRIAFLSIGHADGVRPGMPVRSALGLVGRVLETGRNTARVLLLTDGSSMVPVRRNTDDVIAFAEGRADGSLHIRLINLGINPLKKGDVFVTSGAGGIYRPGIAVAVVEEITRDGALASPLANPAAAIHVAVDPIWSPPPAADAIVPAPQTSPSPGPAQ